MTNFEKWKRHLRPEDLKSTDHLYGADVVPFEGHCDACPAYNGCPRIPSGCLNKFLAWANADTEDTKYIIRGEGDVGPCMFSSFWNGRRFEKGEENAKVFDRRESAEEEMNRFGYSPRDYSILDATEL